MKRNSEGTCHMIQESAGERERTGKVMLFNAYCCALLHVPSQKGEQEFLQLIGISMHI